MCFHSLGSQRKGGLGDKFTVSPGGIVTAQGCPGCKLVRSLVFRRCIPMGKEPRRRERHWPALGRKSTGSSILKAFKDGDFRGGPRGISIEYSSAFQVVLH